MEALPKNLWVTRQRVALLRKLGFLESVRVYVEPQALYCLTLEGYQLLKNRREILHEVSPLKTIDFRYFEHDRRISMCRVALQRSGRAKEWYPDRFIRKSRGFPYRDGFYKLPSSILPDVIFISSKGDRIALEVELTPKKKSRYEEKRRGYESLFLDQDGEERLLRGVLFVTTSERIGKDLSEVFGRVGHDGYKIVGYDTLHHLHFLAFLKLVRRFGTNPPVDP